MNKFTVYIPSKGRASACSTAAILSDAGINFKIVVEPLDFDAYSAKYGRANIVVMPENNRGIGYARNFIKSHSISKGEKYHWQIDDDLIKVRKRVNGKNVDCSIGEIFDHIEAYALEHSNVAVCGMPFEHIAWTLEKTPLQFNKSLTFFVLLNNKTAATYRINTAEDYDYCLQCLKDGYVTVRFNTFMHRSPLANVQSGGCTEIRKTMKEKEPNINDYWPGWFTYEHDEFNNIKLKPSRIWSQFKQVPSNTLGGLNEHF